MNTFGIVLVIALFALAAYFIYKVLTYEKSRTYFPVELQPKQYDREDFSQTVMNVKPVNPTNYKKGLK